MPDELREEEVENSEVAKAVASFQGERELVGVGVQGELKFFPESGEVECRGGERGTSCCSKAKVELVAGETGIPAIAFNGYWRTPLLFFG